MMKLLKKIWHLRRDIVSQGFDDALKEISKVIPLKVHKFPTGIKCWTWTVPEKWEVEEAYIEDLDGNRLLDLEDHPLHVMSYSLLINKTITKKELLKHLYTNPKMPQVIPFKFKYYERDWGFCIEHEKLKNFTKNKYRVVINSSFSKGELKVGEISIKGKKKETIVLVAHLCHPAMANDDASGVVVLVDIAKALKKKRNNYSYKILLPPETIGSVAYLSQNENIIKDIECGISLDMLGSDNVHTLQFSRQGNTELDRIALYVMRKELDNFSKGSFLEFIGNDEKVFDVSGIDIPMISIHRFPYPEYHTSADNLDIISSKNLEESKKVVLEILNIYDKNYIPKSTFKGPLFLSGYGLWVDWQEDLELNKNLQKILLNLNGDKSIFEIAELLNVDFYTVLNFVDKLFKKGLVKKV